MWKIYGDPLCNTHPSMSTVLFRAPLQHRTQCLLFQSTRQPLHHHRLLLFQSTRRYPPFLFFAIVSIHAPAAVSAMAYRCFNPRARAGRDYVDIAPITRGAWVSIHAPARGATKPFQFHGAYGTFQSTRPRGARPYEIDNRHDREKFQSTRPRGARHAIAPKYIESYWFQSTRPRGARQTETTMPAC